MARSTIYRRQFHTFPWEAPSALYSESKLQQIFPLISVVLPIYNQAPFAEGSIEGALSQDYPFIELIIVDDGSTDDLPDVLARFSEDARVTIIKQDNLGVSAALNAGFSVAKGAFLSWTSADNNYRQGAFKALGSYLLANPSVALCYANVMLVDETGAEVKHSSYRPVDQAYGRSSVLELPLSADTIACSHDNYVNACFLFRRSVLDILPQHNSTLEGFEDFDFWLRASLLGAIAHIDTEEPYYEYRLHEGSLTSQLDARELEYKVKAHVAAFRQQESTFSGKQRLQICFNPTRDNALAHLMMEALKAHLPPASVLETAPQQEDGSKVAVSLEAPGAEPCYAKVVETGEEVSYRHSGHSVLHGEYFINPFIVLRDESPYQIPPASLFCPPIVLPKTLRRARWSDYGAVAQVSETHAAALIFTPDKPLEETASFSRKDYEWTLQRIADAIMSQSDITFVLFCCSKEQRNTADEINLALIKQVSNKNLRIIDVSDTSVDLSSILEAKMFALSSVDAVFSVQGPKFGISSLLELRAEAALAAASGTLQVVCGESSAAELVSMDWQEETRARYGCGRLGASFFPAPHTAFWHPGSALSLSSLILDLLPQLDQRSMEQWLENENLQHFGKRMHNVLLA